MVQLARLLSYFSTSFRASAGLILATPISQQAIGAATRSELCAAIPARSNRLLISSVLGSGKLSSLAKPSSHCCAEEFLLTCLLLYPSTANRADHRIPRGAGPSKRSISTRQVCAEGPCANWEVPLSLVSTLGFPARHIPSSSGSYQAPVESCTTSGINESSMTAPARQVPRSLNTRTTSPSHIPRSSAI